MMLPIAMGGGVIFYRWMENLTFLSPYLLFIMLVITYCRIDFKEFRITRFHVVLLTLQMSMAAVAYFLLCWWSHVLAEGIFICIFIPTATAAPVITGMLGGNINRLATYSLMCNLFVAALGPLVLAAIGEHPEISFTESFLIILRSVFPLLIFPIIISALMKKWTPRARKWLADRQSFSFYIWAVSLFIVVGSSVSFAINAYTPEKMPVMILLAAGALAACLIQFAAGRKAGAFFGDKISGGQSLGQKNTLLAVWISLVYLNPLASIAPASYVAWQNIINSWQLIRYENNKNMERKSIGKTDR